MLNDATFIGNVIDYSIDGTGGQNTIKVIGKKMKWKQSALVQCV